MKKSWKYVIGFTVYAVVCLAIGVHEVKQASQQINRGNSVTLANTVYTHTQRYLDAGVPSYGSLVGDVGSEGQTTYQWVEPHRSPAITRNKKVTVYVVDYHAYQNKQSASQNLYEHAVITASLINVEVALTILTFVLGIKMFKRR